MKTHVAAISRCNEAIAASEARIVNTQDQRRKLEAAHTAAVGAADSLRTKASRAMAFAAVGEGDAAAAQALSADLAAAEAKARNFQLTLAGLADVEQAATAAVEQARQDRGAAVRAALREHFDALAAEYRKQAVAFVDVHRRMLALFLIRRTLGPPDVFSPFRSELAARELAVPALAHAVCDGDRAGIYGEMLYSATFEMFHPHQGRQAEATDAEIALLRKQGLEI